MQVRLKHSKEVVCLAMTDSLVAVGSQSHISLVDPRRKTPVQEIESLDHSHGADLHATGLAPHSQSPVAKNSDKIAERHLVFCRQA